MAIDPWDRAAECGRAIGLCTDRERKLVLTHLRDYWLALGNEKAGGVVDWRTCAEEADRLHLDILKAAQQV
jgi:hypothetical protein